MKWFGIWYGLLYSKIFVIIFFSLQLTRCSDEHLQFSDMHIWEGILLELCWASPYDTKILKYIPTITMSTFIDNFYYDGATKF